MERRKFLIGIGSLTAGGAAATGTGAVTSFSADDREANINIANDNRGLFALRPNTDGNVIRQGSDGKFLVDFTANGRAGGVNTDSRYQLGTFSRTPPGSVKVFRDKVETNGARNDPAFKIVNQSSQKHDISVTFNGYTVDSRIYIQVDAGTDGDAPGKDWGQLETSSSTDRQPESVTAEVYDVPAGGYAGVSMLVNTTDNFGKKENVGGPDQDLSGTLQITATESE